MNVLVMKFGGKSLSTPKRILKIADIVISRRERYENIVVVVSAMGKTTDSLLCLAEKIADSPSKREQDMLVSVGERISMALLAMALNKKGAEAISFTGSQSGIITSSEHSEAKIIDVFPTRLVTCLQKGKVVIVAGFQGMSREREITTLGRGGSDTTAVALAIALGGKRVEFYKDVKGVFSEDPKKNKKAEFFKRMTYSKALEIIKGSPNFIVHPRSILLAQKNGVALHIVPCFGSRGEGCGTIIEDREIFFRERIKFEED